MITYDDAMSFRTSLGRENQVQANSFVRGCRDKCSSTKMALSKFGTAGFYAAIMRVDNWMLQA